MAVASELDALGYESIKRYVGFDQDRSERARGVTSHRGASFRRDHRRFLRGDRSASRSPRSDHGGKAQIERLKRTLLGWLESVLLGPYDLAYLESHSRIGRVHVRIELPQQLMFTAMNRIRIRLLEVAHSAYPEEPEESSAAARAVNQILDLELAIMLDAYRENYVERVRDAERLATIGRLAETERRHRAVVEAMPAFVLALDAAGKISLWNRRLEEVTGNGRAEMLGQPGRELVGTGGDRRLPLKTGGHRIARWQLTELASPAETYAFGIDVTEEREVQRRVLRAERLAAVGTLAAGLAHEVRNPLNSATLQLQVLGAGSSADRPSHKRPLGSSTSFKTRSGGSTGS